MQPHLTILGYHKIGPPSPAAWDTWYYLPVDIFERQMTHLRDGGWNVIDAQTLLSAAAHPQQLPPRSVAITFDDAYSSVLHHAAPVLCEFRFPAVVFAPTAFVGGASTFDSNSREPVEPICSWPQLGELINLGFSIQSHGVSHRSFVDLTDEQIQSELADSKLAIESTLNQPVRLFAYPFSNPGNRPDKTASLLRQCGYDAACLFTGGPIQLNALPDPYFLPRLPMWRDTDMAVHFPAFPSS